MIAIDGKTVRGARNKTGKAPHLVAAFAHGIGAVLGQVAVEELCEASHNSSDVKSSVM